MNEDPRQQLARAPMKVAQVIAVAITIGLNALDGFDVQSISFASTGIATEWHLLKTALGIVLSMELVGMALGSILLGGVADRMGRRRTILGCLFVMTVSMLLVTRSTSISTLIVWRLLTGIGIGGMLATTNATVSEFSNARRQHLNVALMAIGYPIGAVVGGIIVSHLLIGHDWRSVFYLGASFSLLFIPIAYFLLPESVQWLLDRQPLGALTRVNQTLQRLHQPPLSSLPAPSAQAHRSVTDVFAPGLLATTVIVTVAYFFHVIGFYFILKWVPTLVVNMGFAPSSASTVLVWANVGGAIGGAVLGLLTLRVGLKALTIAIMLLSALMIVVFGHSPPDLQRLALICAVTGFCTNGGIVGMYALFARAFPTSLRATGTGVAIGIGRGGSVLAPILAGLLLDDGLSVAHVASVMAVGPLIAAIVLSTLRLPRPAAVI